MRRILFAAAVLGLLACGSAHAGSVADLGRPVGTITVGLGGPLLPLPMVTYERYAGLRDAVFVDTGLLPLLVVNVAEAGVGYRRYLTGGPRGGLHLGLEAEWVGGASIIDTFSLIGASATGGGKIIARHGFTLDVRAGAGVYTTHRVACAPKVAITLGSTTRAR